MNASLLSPSILIAENWKDFELLDSGHGRKLERYGSYRFIRPEGQAIWAPLLPESEWQKNDGAFLTSIDSEEEGGKWRLDSKVPEFWPLTYGHLRFNARCTPFRHLGFFPEQSVQWEWCGNLLRTRPKASVLNLFAYTGLASLAAAESGAEVTHVDSSKKAMLYAGDNQALSNFKDKPIRWITEDVVKFVKREIRRGSHYDGIILDPPKFGRGPKNEVWKLFEDLPELLALCRQLLSPNPLFLVLTAYATRSSFLSLHQGVEEALKGLHGKVESGEMTLKESAGGRLLPTAIFSRWKSS